MRGEADGEGGRGCAERRGCRQSGNHTAKVAVKNVTAQVVLFAKKMFYFLYFSTSLIISRL